MKTHLTSEEILALFDAARGDTFRNKRDIVMLKFVRYTGIKTEDIIAMKVADVDSQTGEIMVGWGDFRRKAKLPEDAIGDLKKYIAALKVRQGQEVLDKAAAFFPAVVGDIYKGVTRQAIHNAMQEYARISKLKKKVNLMQLRDAFAFEHLQKGVLPDDLQKMLGLQTKTTMIKYVKGLKG